MMMTKEPQRENDKVIRARDGLDKSLAQSHIARPSRTGTRTGGQG
jgi:hypothetical protein